MAYSIPNIIQWAKASQALAAIGEGKNLATRNGTIEDGLDVKLYTERKSLEYAYAQDPSSNQTFLVGQGVLALCGQYIFEAQEATGSGGSITPITPSNAPDEYDFEVSASSFIADGDSSVTFPPSWEGFNILFVRNNITQSKVNQGGTYFSWDKTTRTFTLINGNANTGELFQIYPII